MRDQRPNHPLIAYRWTDEAAYAYAASEEAVQAARGLHVNPAQTRVVVLATTAATPWTVCTVATQHIWWFANWKPLASDHADDDTPNSQTEAAQTGLSTPA